ncbi:hypothetical protein Btru_039451 [Bulinus truncatus]|nr:hypothetical protein Btru_039451 [Bulinus truncatus]
MDGANFSVCQNDGKWTAPGSCKAEYCEKVPPIANGYYKLNSTYGSNDSIVHELRCVLPNVEHGCFSFNHAIEYNEEVTLSCFEGYKIKRLSTANATLQCTETGKLNFIDRCIVLTCSLPEPTDLELAREPQGLMFLKPGESLKITCKMQCGNNSKILHCARDMNGGGFRLQGDNPRCLEVNCGDIPWPEILGVVRKELNDTTYGHSIQFDCEPGFIISGHSSLGNTLVECQRNGIWGFNTLTCLDKEKPIITSCPELQPFILYELLIYELPKASDNSGHACVVLESGPPSGVSVVSRNTTLRFRAFDSSNNEAFISCEIVLKAKTCLKDTLKPPDHGEIKVCAGTNTNMTCQAHCSTGYIYQDLTNVKSYTCVFGQWLSKFPLPPCLEIGISVYDYKISVTYLAKGQESGFPHAEACLESHSVYLYSHVLKQKPCKLKVHSLQFPTSHSFDLGMVRSDFSMFLDASGVGEILLQHCSVYLANSSYFGPFPNKSPVDCLEPWFESKTEVTPGTLSCLIGQLMIQNFCLQCGPGHFINNGSCTECPNGTYQDQDGQNNCIKCITQYSYYPRTSKSHCYELCPEGFTSSSGYTTEKCAQCQINTYSSDNHTVCEPCSSTAKNNYCAAVCRAGYFSSTRFEPCQPCPTHFYSVNGTQCLECPSETFTLNKGSSNLNDCISDGFEPCQPCPTHFYSVNGTQCLECPSETFTLNKGSSNLNDCISDGYYGERCNESCECSSKPCYNNEECIEKGLKLSCECLKGLHDYLCEIDDAKVCNNCSSIINDTHHSCGFDEKCNGISRQFCDPNPCLHGECQQFGTVRYVCVCHPGYTGLKCDVDIDECVMNPQGCLHAGSCNNEINGYTCSCKNGFTGEKCEIYPEFCDGHSCAEKAGGICVKNYHNLTYGCLCPKFYDLRWTGKNCHMLMDYCMEKNHCRNDAVCYNLDEWHILCMDGTHGRMCEKKIDLCEHYGHIICGGGTCQPVGATANCHCDHSHTSHGIGRIQGCHNKEQFQMQMFSAIVCFTTVISQPYILQERQKHHLEEPISSKKIELVRTLAINFPIDVLSPMSIASLIFILVDVSFGFVPNPSAGYTYNKLSSFGKKFYFGVSYVGYGHFPKEELDVFVMMHTFSSAKKEVIIRSKSVFLGERSKSVFIRHEELNFFHIRDISVGYLLAWTISTVDPNQHIIWCNRGQSWNNHTDIHRYQLSLDQICSDFTHEPSTRGIYFKLQHPVLLFTHDINENVGGQKYCDDKDNFVGEEAVLPNAVLGTEFVTIFTEVPTFRHSLLILTVHSETDFKVYSSADKYETYKEFEALHVYEIVVTQEGRLLVSSKPVMVQAIMRPTCTTPADAMFDFAYTYLLPEHLYYNDYLVGNPNMTGISSTVKIIISTLGMNSLTNNDQLIKPQVQWKEVSGKLDWKIGQTQVIPRITNRFKSDTYFACYIFNSGKRKGDVHPAGYKTHGNDSLPATKQCQSEVQRAMSTSKGLRSVSIDWLIVQALVQF